MTADRRVVAALRGVVKEFPARAGSLRVLDGVEAEIRERDFIVVTGPSGSGKTTLLHVLSLLEPATSGEVELDGRSTSSLNDRARARLRAELLAMVFQRFHLLPNRSVLDNVLFRFRYAEEKPARARDLALDALRQLGLEDMADKPVQKLSGGEMQRVAIARATVAPPRLLLADEPTGNLDLATAEGIVQQFAAIHATGVTILLVTHNPIWFRAGTRRWDMAGGRIKEVS